MIISSKKPIRENSFPCFLSVNENEEKDWIIFSSPFSNNVGKHVFKIVFEKMPESSFLKFFLLNNVFNLDIYSGREPKKPKQAEFVVRKEGNNDVVFVEYEKTSLFNDYNLMIELINNHNLSEEVKILSIEKIKV